MKHLAAVALFLLLIPGTGSAQDKPNFTGTWILDVAGSSITPSPALPIEPETMVVTQTAKELRFERLSTIETTKTAVQFEYAFTATSPAAGILASWDRDALVLSGWTETPEGRLSRSAHKQWPQPPLPSRVSPSGPGLRPASMVVWSLSEGGKTLTVQGLAVRAWTESSGDKVSEEVRAKWVYRKQ